MSPPSVSDSQGSHGPELSSEFLPSTQLCVVWRGSCVHIPDAGVLPSSSLANFFVSPSLIF